MDNHTRECLAIEVGQSLTGACVAEALSNVIAGGRELPKRIQTDDRPEFISVALDKWAYDNNVVLDFSRPGKPTENPFVESFNGSFRDECLNDNWFMPLEDAKKRLKTGDRTIIIYRPHSSLSDTPPTLFAKQFEKNQHSQIFYLPAVYFVGGHQSQLPGWFEDYNSNHPRSALGYLHRSSSGKDNLQVSYTAGSVIRGLIK